jgi:peroxiredoxin
MRLRPSAVMIPLILVVGLVLGAGCATTGQQGASPPAAEPAKAGPVLTPAAKNPRAPEVSFLDNSGGETPISSFAGKTVVLVNFWGVRCQNCIEEIPFLERLYHKYGGRGLAIMGVNTDGIDAATLGRFLPQLPKMSYTIVVDPDFKVNDAFQMSAAPLTILVAKDGTIRYRHEGYTPEIEQEYVDLIEKLLAE